MYFRRLSPLTIALMLLGASPVVAQVAERPDSTVSGGNAPGMKDVVYGFFNDRTGERIGRLRIESVGVEYQRHGFLRVAWDPLVVLDGVTLEIEAGAVWPEAGTKIIDALRVTGRSGACVLRRVRLRLAGTPAREWVAASGSLRADGGLELTGVTAASGAAPEAGLCFWLTGPRAGQLVATTAGPASGAQTFSAKPTLAHPAP